MATLLVTRGLPGSGKTTYAKRWVGEDATRRSRINRDDLREMLHGGAYGYEWNLEKSVTVAHQAAVRALLMSGKDVICDDMNLANRQVKEWMKVAYEASADFRVVDFTNVAPEECIERDLLRGQLGGRMVGDKYIWTKYQQFIKGKPYPLPMPEPVGDAVPEPYVPPVGKPRAILVDIDGTMALMNGRGPFDWYRVGEDLPNKPVVNLVQALQDANVYYDENDYTETETEIIFMSGRDEVCRTETQIWLRDRGFGAHKLFMRPSLPDGIQQPKDSIVKLALFDEHIRHNYDVQFVLDDRQQVVDMWRNLGLTALQVAPGDF